MLQGMVAEAMDRLKTQTVGRSEAHTKALRALTAVLEGASWPWDLPQELPFMVLQ